MTLFANFKRYLLNRKSKQFTARKARKVSLKEFKNVRYVGILFDASTEDKYRRAAHLVRHFRSLNKEVDAIGLLSATEIPHYADVTLSFNYLKNKEINWYGLPIASFTNDFIKKEFDLLIDLNFEKEITLRYLLKSSMTHCKVGLNQGEDEVLYDFMLEGISPKDLNLFLKELLRYLEMIKTE